MRTLKEHIPTRRFIILMITVGIVLLALTARMYLTSDAVKYRILAIANEQLPGDIEWSDLDISLFKKKVSIRNFVLKDNADTVIGQIDQVDAVIMLSGLLRKHLVFSGIAVQGMQLNLVVEEGGRVNLMHALMPQGPVPGKGDTESGDSAWNVVINRLDARNAAVALHVPDGQIDIEVDIPRFTVSNMDVGRSRVKMDLAIENLRYRNPKWDQKVRSANIKAHLSGDTVDLRQIDIHSEVADVRLSGKMERIYTQPQMDLAVRADIDIAKAGDMMKANLPASGRVQVDAALKGGFENPHINISAVSDKITVDGLTIHAVKLNAAFRDRVLKIGDGGAETRYGNISLAGSVDLEPFWTGAADARDRVSYNLTARLDRSVLSTLIPNSKWIKGILDAAVSVKGKGTDPKQMDVRFDTELTANGLPASADREETVSVRASGAVQRGILRISHFNAQGYDATLTGQAQYHLNTRDTQVVVALDIPDVRAVAGAAGKQVSGRLTLKGQFAGPVDRLAGSIAFSASQVAFSPVTGRGLEGEVDLSFAGPLSAKMTFLGEGLRYGELIAMNAAGSVGLKDGQIAVDSLVLTAGLDSEITLNGSIQILDPKTGRYGLSNMDLELNGEKISPGQFYDGAAGIVFLTGRMTGSPETLKGLFEIEGRDLSVHGEKIPHLNAAIDVAGSKIHVRDVAIRSSHGGVILGEARYGLDDGMITADIRTTDFPLKSVKRLEGMVDDPWKADLKLKAAGRIDNPTIDAELRLKDITVREEKLPDISMEVRMKDRKVNLESDFKGKWTGFYDMASTQYRMRIVTDGLELAPYMRMATGKDTLSGKLSTSVVLEGRMNDARSLAGNFAIDGLAVYYGRQEVVRSERIHVAFLDGLPQAQDIRFDVLEKGQGRIHIEQRENLGMVANLRIELPFQSADPVIEQISDTAGMLRLDLMISGSPGKPEVSATLSLEDVGMSFSVMDNAVSKLNGQIHYAGGRVRSDGLSGLLGDGRFKVSGSADLDGVRVRDVRVAMECVQLPIDFPGVMDLVADGRLLYTASTGSSALNGRLSLVEGRYYKDVKLDFAGLTPEKRPVSSRSRFLERSMFRDLVLNVQVDHKQPFQVENNLASMAIKPDLTVYGTVVNPIVTGRAEVENGIIRFQKKEFEIIKGVVDFADPYKIVPMVSIEAQTDIRDWHIVLKLSGPPENLDFVLISDPEESHADILSLIAVGKTTRELRSAQGGSNFSPAQILAGFMAETVGQNIKEQTGLDQVEIRVEDDENGSGDKTSLALGKELSRQLSVTYGVEVRSGENLQRISSDYRILEALIMNAYQDSAGNFGGGIKLRLEF